MATGDKRSQMLCLKADGELILVAGNNTVPFAENLTLAEFQQRLALKAIIAWSVAGFLQVRILVYVTVNY
jgi:hypothetical protein